MSSTHELNAFLLQLPLQPSPIVSSLRIIRLVIHGSLADAAKSILEYVNKRVNKQSALARIEMLAEPFKKTATQKIRRFLYMSPSHA